MRYWLIIFCILYLSDAGAQKFYVMEYNNDTTFARNSITLESPRLKKDFFLLDNEVKISTKKVVLYNSQEGYFRRSSFPTGFFVKRITEGRVIDEYSTELSTYTPAYTPGPGGGGGYFNKSTVYYYSMNGGGLKELKYSNLKKDVSDNVVSLDYLNRIKKQNITDGVFYSLGAGLLIYGISKSKINSDNVSIGGYTSSSSVDNGEESYISPYVFASIIPVSIPLFRSKKRIENLRAAISAYNK
jgi:hypothetical protein